MIRYLRLGSLICVFYVTVVHPALSEPIRAGEAIVNPVDGALMVYVPPGPFIMGLDHTEADQIARLLGARDADALWMWECYPRRTVELDGYFIDQYEVTVGQWHRFVVATGYTNTPAEISRHYGQPGGLALPVAKLRQSDAQAYCAWAGKALPSDEQWEKACRGTDGRWWPWGQNPPTPVLAELGPDSQARLYTWVGQFPKGASPYGCMDMIGNQYEWTAGTVTPYPENPEAARMATYSSASNRCVRGGSWYHGIKSGYASKRMGFENNTTYYHIGFRSIWVPPAGWLETEAFRNAQGAVEHTRSELAAEIAKGQAASATNNYSKKTNRSK